MCGRYTLTREDDLVGDFEAALGDAPKSEWWKPRFNVAPTQPAPVITQRDGARTIQMMRWGLVPHWSGPGGKPAPLMINARMESLDAKAIFRDLMRHRRCLVPADGFFEWQRPASAGKAKPQPIYLHPASRKLFAFAGLWARARNNDVETLSFTIITSKPNELVARYHNRMALVLPPSAYAAWLDPGLDADGAHALLEVPPVGDWIAEPVSTLVNNANHDEPACIEPVAPPQQSLF